MKDSIKMSVSSLTRKGDEKAIYILFSDENCSAEFTLPECRLLRSKGFSDEELNQLKTYVDSERDLIYNMAKEINTIKAFMK